MQTLKLDDAYIQATNIAEKIISGEVSVYLGSMQIWKEIIDNLQVPCPDDLWPFKSNASAIEDIKWNAEQGGQSNEALITECEQEIISAAKALVTNATPSK